MKHHRRRRRPVRSLWAGLAAGAAGTTALNAVTYLDMTLSGRPSSTTPEDTVAKGEDLMGISLGDDRDTAANRRSGIGALLGIATGVGIGAAYALAQPALRTLPLPVRGAVAGLAATAGPAVPMTTLGVTDPRTWSASSWARDLVPHRAYGLVTVTVYEALRR